MQGHVQRALPTVFIWGSPQGKPLDVYRSTNARASWQRINDDAHQFGGTGSRSLPVRTIGTA